MSSIKEKSYYEVLEVTSDASVIDLRESYRRLARQHHPDINSDGDPIVIRQINKAWRTLSDPDKRSSYDKTLSLGSAASATIPTPMPYPGTNLTRRQAWVAGVQIQIYTLALQAGRSATQTLLAKHPLGNRAEYDNLVESLAIEICQDTEAKVRAARAAGSAPLDLGVSSTLIGIRCAADDLSRQVLGRAARIPEQMEANLLDRMWDVLAHELSHTLTTKLGGNPQTSRLFEIH